MGVERLAPFRAWAAGCAVVLICAACGPIGTREIPPIGPLIRNDMATTVIVELRSGDSGWNVEVPPRARASVGSMREDSMTARVFRFDCTELGIVELSPEEPIIYVEADGRVRVGVYGEPAYVNPTPYMTELDLMLTRQAPGCSGD